MRIYSWNVNGLRACDRNGFSRWLARGGAEIVAVQEVRARADQLPDRLRKPRRWHTTFVSAQRPGYSGVGVYSRRPPDNVSDSIGVRSLDIEGRVQLVRFGELLLVNAYFPNGNGKERDNSRVPFKLRFYRRLFKVLDEERKAGGRILVMGDFNTAHLPIDLARPKQNKKTSGFLPEERRELDRWIRAGWIDTFRTFDQRGDRYTWWAQRSNCRGRNIGWRLDLILASEGVVQYLRGARIHSRVTGSDHCPVSIDVDPLILKT